MKVTYFIPILFLVNNCEAQLTECVEPKENMTDCVKNVLSEYFSEANLITYVNLNFTHEDDMLDDIHSLMILPVVVKTMQKTLVRVHRSYIILARDEIEFSHAYLLKKDKFWNPYVRFFVVIKNLDDSNLRQIFDIAFKLRVYNIVVMNGTDSAELYSYNPFEDYACGKYYNRIIEHGKCSEVESDLYPVKTVTGLRNCTFHVSVPHWPPFAIDPEKDSINAMGVEQYIFHLMSEVEKFSYTFNYNYDAEVFSLVTDDNEVSGPMQMLLDNMTDVMMGALFAIPSRTRLFSFVYGHLDYIDEVKIFVKKATVIPAWMNFYLDFTPVVWMLLFAVLVLYSVLLMVLLRTNDKGHVVMVLLDNLLLHGSKFRCKQIVHGVLICWVWFAYLVNCFYTSALVSHTTKPSKTYQVHNEDDIIERNFRPCISSVMQRFMYSESNLARAFQNKTIDSCYGYMNSMRSVSDDKELFTISPYCIFLYHKYVSYDKYGKPNLYIFPKTYLKIIYAMYLNSGFPMAEKLHSLGLRIRETGLVDKSLSDILIIQRLKHFYADRGFVSRFAIPWHIYVIGMTLSTVCFMVELASQYKKTGRVNQY